jgi:hypothetical protein
MQATEIPQVHNDTFLYITSALRLLALSLSSVISHLLYHSQPLRITKDSSSSEIPKDSSSSEILYLRA